MITLTILSYLIFIYLNYKVYKLDKKFNVFDLDFPFYLMYCVTGIWSLSTTINLIITYLP